MEYWLLITGILLILFTYYDMSHTILVNTGAGIMTRGLSQRIWKILLWIAAKQGSKKLLNISGLATIMALLFTWLIFIWAGSSMIYISVKDSVVDSKTLIPAGVVNKIYFTGYTLSTMGNGDFKPNGDFWKIFTTFLSFLGLMQITLVISYLIPFLSANQLKRSLSVYITSMGGSPQKILLNGWNGNDFSNLKDHFIELNSQIMQHGQNHLTYPILHYYHSSEKNESAIINIAALDEALSLLMVVVPKQYHSIEMEAMILRKAITSYLSTVNKVFIKPAKKIPPKPDFNLLEKSGIPIEFDEKITENFYKDLDLRRRLLYALVENDGWKWDDIIHRANEIRINSESS